MSMSATPTAEEIVACLLELETGQVSDVLDEAGLPDQVLAAALVRRDASGRFAGRVTCARGAPIIRGSHAAMPIHQDLLETLVENGTILVMSASDFSQGALLGGLIAGSLQRAGCGGIITDGAVRDIDELRSLGLPVVSSAVTPINGSRRWQLTEADVPVDLPGQNGRMVRICPGDFILCDNDGIVVIPAVVAGQIVEDTLEVAQVEARIAAALAAGEPRSRAFAAHPRFKHVRPARA
jgi:4-hydroxy-4-methyl-2-oxoglutarate aldolase